jgi:hypothetical protein
MENHPRIIKFEAVKQELAELLKEFPSVVTASYLRCSIFQNPNT